MTALLYFCTVASVILIVAYLYVFVKRRQIIKHYPLPGPLLCTTNIFWPLRHEVEILKDLYKHKLNPGRALFRMMDSLQEQYESEGLFRIWLLLKPLVFVFRADTVEEILKSTVEINKLEELALVETFVTKGLLTSNGALWREKRKMLTPVFHFSMLEKFMPTMNEQAVILTDLLLEKENQFIEVGSYMIDCALDIICETAMGVSIKAQQCECEYTRSLRRVTESFIERFLKPWLWSNQFYQWTPSGREYYRQLKVVHGLTRKVISTRLEEMLKQGEETDRDTKGDTSSIGSKKKKPLLDLLLEKHLQDKTLTLEDIREEVDTFMFAGHDTSAAAMMWALYLLGLHPELQEKVHNELDRVFGDDRTRPVVTEDLCKLTYLECVIKETLRLYPSAPVVGRRVLNDFTIGGQYKISRGSSLLIDIYHTHRDPKAFPNPEAFIPERFLPENAAKINPFAYVPFSAGPRNCIGQKFAMREMKVVLATVLRQAQVKSSVPIEQIDMMFEVVLVPTRPVLLKVRRRPENNCDYFE